MNVKYVICYLLLFFCFYAVGGKFRLDYGSELSLCQDLKAYLEEQYKQINDCSAPRSEYFEHVKEVEWKPFSRQVARKVILEMQDRFPDYIYQKEDLSFVGLSALLEDFERMNVHSTKIDLDLDGILEHVIRIQDNRCDVKYGPILNIVLNSEQKIDSEFYYLNKTHYQKKFLESSRRLSNISAFHGKQLFMYKGKSYLFFAHNKGGGIGQPKLRAASLFTFPICSLNQNKSTKK